MKKKYKIILTFVVPYLLGLLNTTTSSWFDFKYIIQNFIVALGYVIPVLVISFALASLTFLNKSKNGKRGENFWTGAMIISIGLTALIFLGGNFSFI